MQNSVWFQIEAQTRNFIKEALLGNLGENKRAVQDMQFMKDICSCICAIAVVEIPTGEWPDFIDSMSNQGNQNENHFFKKAGIFNLGWIMEELQPSDINSQDDLNKIWTTMLSNIDASDLELTRIVAKSISKLSSASESNFKIQEQQMRIMQGVFDLLKI